MKPETIGEINIMFTHLMTEVQKISSELKENTNLSLQIHSEVKKTNGRVNVIEPLAFDYRERRAQAKGAVTMWVLLGTVVVSGIGLLGTLYLDKVQREITDGVVSTLESKYNIDYEKDNPQVIKKK